MKVILLITQIEAAGAQNAMLKLATGLRARQHVVQVVTMYDKGGDGARIAREYGVAVVDLQMKRQDRRSLALRFADGVSGLWRLYRLMRRERFDVAQTFSHYSNIAGSVVAWLAGIRVRVSSQRASLRDSPRWLLNLDRVVANSRLVAAMVAVAEATRRFSIETQGIHPDKLVTIHNGVDVGRFTPVPDLELGGLRRELALPEGAPVVVTVARLHRQKGHRFLLQAMPTILARFPEVRFLFAGEGPLSENLESEARELGVAGAVHFLGSRRDIPALLSLSQLCVLPSLWEGLPHSILEAMATERPVVATRVDGSPELVLDGETGFLVPPGDADALAQTIIRLLGDPVLRVQMGRRGRARVAQEFSDEKFITAYLELYSQLLETTGGRFERR